MKVRKKYKKRTCPNRKRVTINGESKLIMVKKKKIKPKVKKIPKEPKKRKYYPEPENPYSIVLFSNKKRIRKIVSTQTKDQIYEHWERLKNAEIPPFLKEIGFKRKLKTPRIYELGLIFPKKTTTTKQYIKDSLGRTLETKLNNNNYYIKRVIPYWDEETIFNYDTRKKMYYNELIELIKPITDITQIFSLKIKIFVQVEDDIKFTFSLKSTYDCQRLFDILRSDILQLGLGNFIFVKDVNTTQRLQLYDMLVKKGFNRQNLIKTYSY